MVFPDEDLGFERDHYIRGWNKDNFKQLFPIALDQKIIDPFKKAIRDANVDIVVADYCTIWSVRAANQLGLPVVITMCMALTSHKMCEPQTPSHQMVRSSLCGCLCICPIMEQSLHDFAFKNLLNPEHFKFYGDFNKLTLLCTSSWGFEKPRHMPPNVVLTGPILIDDESTYLEKLHKKSADLAAWLDDAHDNDEIVVYITLGSEVVWQ